MPDNCQAFGFLAMQCSSRRGFPAPVKNESRAIKPTDGSAWLVQEGEAAALAAIDQNT
jgi:hypothetical protein